MTDIVLFQFFPCIARWPCSKTGCHKISCQKWAGTNMSKIELESSKLSQSHQKLSQNWRMNVGWRMDFCWRTDQRNYGKKLWWKDRRTGSHQGGWSQLFLCWRVECCNPMAFWRADDVLCMACYASLKGRALHPFAIFKGQMTCNAWHTLLCMNMQQQRIQMDCASSGCTHMYSLPETSFHVKH